MSKSTAPASRRKSKWKPAKPYAAFPLFAHANGSWAKKVRGKLHYFGSWDDPDAALTKWQLQEHDLRAGRTPRVLSNGLTVRDLVNRFLGAKKNKLDSGELSTSSFADYYSTCARVVEAFGRNRLVEDLRSEDFEKLRATMAEGRAPSTLSNEVQRTRVLFKFAFDADLIDRPLKYGPDFRKATAKVMRQHRQGRGVRMFEPADLRRIIDAASQPLKAMVFLGLNAGYGNNDCAMLPIEAVDLESGWVTFPRPKTAIQRRCWLWPETAAAIREWLVERPKASDPHYDRLVFTTIYGHAWYRHNALKIAKAQDEGVTVKVDRSNPISAKFAKLVKQLKLYRPGLGFYTLRHVFETIGGESRDQVAVNAIMGHSPAQNDMASIYRERISDDRLQAVAEHVRGWLFAKGVKAK